MRNKTFAFLIFLFLTGFLLFIGNSSVFAVQANLNSIMPAVSNSDLTINGELTVTTLNAGSTIIASTNITADTIIAETIISTTNTFVNLEVSDTTTVNVFKDGTATLDNGVFTGLATVNSTVLTDGNMRITSGAIAGGVTGTFSGNVTASTLDTGQGKNELYDMDQNVLQASDVTFNAVNSAVNYEVNGADINTGGTLDNVGYLDQNQTFAGEVTFSATANISTLAYPSEATVSITGTANTIAITGSHMMVSADAEYLMAGTPSLTTENIRDGMVLYIMNIGDYSVTLQDNADLSDTEIYLGGNSGTIIPEGTMELMYMTMDEKWRVMNNQATTVNVQADSILQVRNASGGAIAAGEVVYETGYNVGHARTTIAKADADDSTKMPSIGVAIAAMNNNQNGSIIIHGQLGGLNTSAYSVGDSLYVSTNAGALTNVRPSIDDIQKIAEVSRSHASNGQIIVVGAGRSNDVPWNFEATNVTVNALVTSTLDVIDAAGGDLLSLGVDTEGASPRITMKSRECGFAAPSTTNASSDGDKWVFWNKSYYKGAIGFNSRTMWFQSTEGTETDNNRFRFYAGSSAVPIELLSMGNGNVGFIWNEVGEDIDFRVETNNDENALYVDGGTDFSGFGTSTPDAKIDVVGGIIVSETVTANEFVDGSNTSTQWADAYSKRVDTWGNGLEYASETAAVDYNTTNLKITSNELDTIQSIATGADFTVATLNATTVNATSITGTLLTAAQPNITSLGILTALQVDNLNLNGNSFISTAGDINITPTAGSDVVIDSHFEFDGTTMTALTDNDTTIAAYAGKGIIIDDHFDIDGAIMTGITNNDTTLTAYTGKNFTIESVTFDGGAMGGVTTLSMNNVLTSTLADGTAPMLVESGTVVATLNVDQVDGYDFNQSLQTTDEVTFVTVNATIVGDVITSTQNITKAFIPEPSATVSIVAGTGLNALTDPIMRVQGNGGAVTVTATPSIVAGQDGQIIWVIGDSDANNVKWQDEAQLGSSGLALSGGQDFTMGKGDVLQLVYDAGESKYYEISRSDN